MPRYALDGTEPAFSADDPPFIAPGAHVVGAVTLGAGTSVWFGAVIRGDNEPVRIGAGTNVQDGAVLHSDPGSPLAIGRNCTIGHRAVVHGCTVGDNTLIGMGAVVLNGARIGHNSLVGAGALVTENKAFPDNSLIVGSPAKAIRTLDEATVEGLARSAETYRRNARRFRDGLQPLDDA
ncbi:gamma carbonic anhydrase family protein [Aureimonas sp. AU4]|uniref:gamma carbonic anhydrase family protein n=1 Tax=Aureimonas sp. AU4 TaxID=1638163 RepID=UPI00078474C8|nr:gamma carbonic anhydrase family protein [Aureimonas sp. AU4]